MRNPTYITVRVPIGGNKFKYYVAKPVIGSPGVYHSMAMASSEISATEIVKALAMVMKQEPMKSEVAVAA